MRLQQSYISVLLISLFYTTVQAQNNCVESTAQEYIQNSEMKILFRNGGDRFWDGSTAKYEVPHVYGQAATNTIFAGATWMGGYDNGGSLYVAAQTYRSGGNDYWAGPIDVSSGTPMVNSCADFDKIWKVRRWAIDQHIADYNDNGVIDGPSDLSLLKWPGRGNPQFAAQMGFSLPANQDLAPFYDRNGDGNYQPLAGDYPVFEHGNANALAEEILWSVFNDMGNLHTQTNGQAMKIEVQQTAYLFSCANDPLLNKTLFVKHKVINKSGRDYHNYYYGVWTDFDLGCSSDDYIGTDSSRNTMYAYNADNNDDLNCPYGAGYGVDPPVQAITILNHPLAHSMYYVNSPGPQGDPVSLLNYYRPLDGQWMNGTPLTSGGNGYNTGGGIAANYVFPDNPNDPSGWSMHTANLTGLDVRMIGSVYKDTLKDGDVFTIDIAHSYHRDPDSNYLQNVNLMEQEVDLVQQYYDNNFSTIGCVLPTYCATNCVYPGDANNNGIDNDFDVLEMGLNYGATAVTRSIVGDQWFPHEPPVPATNAYVDANGDNVVDSLDFMVNTENWQETHALYNNSSEGVTVAGTDLFFERFYVPPPFNLLDTIVDAYQSAVLDINLGDSLQDITDLYGITFRVRYDDNIFWMMNTSNSFFSAEFSPWLGDDGAGIYARQTNEPGKIHYVTTRLDQSNYTGGGKMGQIVLRVKPTAPVSVISTPTEICFEDFKAIRADGSTISIGAECITVLYKNLNFNSVDKISPIAPEIKLYPNPVNYQLNIDLGEERAASIQLFNMLGEEVRSLTNASGIVEMQKNNLAQGMYTVVVHFENGTRSSHKVLFN